jgi:hypothetical protein
MCESLEMMIAYFWSVLHYNTSGAQSIMILAHEEHAVIATSVWDIDIAQPNIHEA